VKEVAFRAITGIGTVVNEFMKLHFYLRDFVLCRFGSERMRRFERSGPTIAEALIDVRMRPLPARMRRK
jgi:hypothetical protein